MASDRFPRRGWFGRGRTRALLSTGMVLGMGAVATSAYWTEDVAVTGTTVQSGALHIDLPGFDRVRGENYGWAALDLSSILPGTSRAQVIRVSNHSVGPVPFTFRVQAAATPSGAGSLGAVLQLKVTDGVVSGTACTGTSIGSGNLNGYDQPAGLPVLASGGFRDLCFEVSRPASPTSVTGSPAQITFTFPATQVP